ncbi:MAG TPA: ribosome-associated translation inhibitor RaiA [Actinomycetota bacterium]|nr:ribosome-associated translation inhibitor RaiA [Actinomycetota bacterium]
MQMLVTGRNTHVSDRLKQMATHKLERVQRFFDRIQTLEIEFSEEHNPRIADKHRVEVTLTTKAHVLRAHASGPDAASAVDLVVDKLEAQVKRLKGKMSSRTTRVKGRLGGIAAPPPVDLSMPVGTVNGSNGRLESPDDEDFDETGPLITRVKRFAVKPMTPEEAVLQMEALGHDFYLFVNAESEQAGVVYRRRDGSFGLIEPD